MGNSKAKNKEVKPYAAPLRKRAEELLKQKFSKPASQLSEAELLKLVHELEVHQIELELQNEELLQAKKQIAELAGEKYLKLYNGSPSGYFTISRDGDIIEANLCGSTMLGKEPKQLIKSRLGFFVSEDTRGTFNSFLDIVFESNAKANCEVTIIRNDFSKIYVHLDGISIEAEEKCLISMVDVTEQKVAEAKILESEKFYRTLFNMLNGFAYCQMLYKDGTPVDFIYLLVNNAFETQTGLKDVCGKKVSEIIPELRETSPELFEFYSRVALTGKPESFEIYLESMKMWFSISAYSPAREYFVAVFDVINERKKAEEVIRSSVAFLKEVQKIVRLGSFSLDFVQGKWSGSELLDILYGIDSDFDKSFEGWISLVHPEWRQLMRDYYYHLAETHDSHFEMDYKIIRYNDKAERWIHVQGQLNFDQDYTPITLVGFKSDITEKKEALEALKESESRFRNMFSGHSSIMLLIDPESGLIIDANDAAVRFYGYDLSSLRSMNIFQINTLDSTQIKIDYTDARNKKRNHFIFPHKLANGMIRMVDVRSSPIYYQDHSILFSVIHDVTDRLQAEHSLKESEEKWRTLFEILPVGVSILDKEGRVKEFNPALEQILGISDKGLESQDYAHRTYLNSESKPMTQGEFPSTIAVNEQRAVQNVEIGVVKEDGETIWTMVSAAPLSLPNISCTIVTRDLTERKRVESELKLSEQQYKNLFEFSGTNIIIVDREGTYLMVNQNAALSFGLSPDEIIGKSMFDLLPEELANNYIKFNQVLFDSGCSRTYEDEFMLEGVKKTFLVVDRCLQDHNGFNYAIQSSSIDITDRIHAELALKESEEKYRNVFNTGRDAFFLINKESGAILDINDSACDLYGYSREEMLGLKNTDMSAETEETRLATKEFHDRIELRYHKKRDGTIFPVDISASQFLMKGSEVILASIRDITERLKSVEEINHARIFLDSIIEHSPNSLWISDEHGTMIRMNQACRNVLHLKDEEVIGKYNLLKDNLLYAQGFMPQIKDVFEKRHTARFITSYNTAAISNLDLQNHVALILDVNICPVISLEGKVTNAIIQHIDITRQEEDRQSLRESEEKYRSVFSSEKSALFLIDNETYAVLDANESACRIYGYTKEEMLQLKNFELSAEPEESKRAKNDFKEKIELRYHKKRDGTIFPVDISASQFSLKGREVTLASVRDISKRIRVEEMIKHKNDELSRVNAEKDKFFSIIAHDLRSPFNGFLGLTELMVEKFDELSQEEIRNIVSIMRTSAINLYRLLGNLLEWSRMQRGLTTLIPLLYPLKPKILESTLLVMDLANKKGITISYDIADDLVVMADGNMFDGIIRNIVINAIKFTPKDGSIFISAASTNEKLVEISIRDTGIGMTREMIDNLFRLDSNTGRKGTEGEYSTGLGLILCKDFIEKHHGKLWIESEVDKGSTFRFTLPSR